MNSRLYFRGEVCQVPYALWFLINCSTSIIDECTRSQPMCVCHCLALLPNCSRPACSDHLSTPGTGVASGTG